MKTKSKITKKERKQKEGVSLIVLVITVIVMIVLAATVIISLTNNGIIEKANEAVNETNLKQAQTIATTIWVESQLTKDDPATIKNKIIAALGDLAANYDIQVYENGVTVKVKEDDKTAPTLTITTPESSDLENPTIVNTATFTVAGTATDSSGVKSVTVNDTEVTVNGDGSWNHNITLTKDENTTITVVATDIYDNVTTEIRYVSYIFIEPGLYKTGSNYTVLHKSWDELISNGIITADGKIVSGKESQLSGDLMISNTITEIADNSYYKCSRLDGVRIPDGVTSIGYQAFSSTAITSADISDSVTTIGNLAFAESFLTSIEIPDSVTAIGNSAFQGCSRLTSVKLPNQITSIDNGVFRNCSELTSIEIPNNVTSIGIAAFDGCYRLENINLPDNVTSISSRAFSSCTGLTSFTIVNGVSIIKDETFENCTNLTSVDIPLTVTTINASAFSKCTNLNDVSFAGTKEQWDAVSKASSWNYKCGQIVVTCIDGTVTVPAYGT